MPLINIMGYQRESPMPDKGTFWELFITGFPVSIQTSQAIAIILICFPECGKTLMKTPHT